MHITFELGSGSRRPIGWRGALAAVFVGSAVVSLVVLIVAAIQGNATMVENAGVALTFLVMFGAPPWIAHALGRRVTSRSGMEHEMARLRGAVEAQHEELRAVRTVLTRLDEVTETLGRLEERLGTTNIRKLPRQENSER